jgi:hypothetical protein
MKRSGKNARQGALSTRLGQVTQGALRQWAYRTGARRNPWLALLVQCSISILIPAMPAAAGDGQLSAAPVAEEISRLKAQLERQQGQIEELQKALQQQQRTIQALEASPAAVAKQATAAPSNPPPEAKTGAPPLSLRIGNTSFTPIGFTDFAVVLRDKNVGSGLGTNFAAIPFDNTVNGNLRDYRLSAQNSRLGFRVDSKLEHVNLLGYVEADFLGFVPGNAAVTANSNSLRMRLFWVDLRRGKWEMLAGQSWSLLTPNRRGVSALPADLFLTQDVDPNIQVGLTWSRSPQVRFTYHASDTVKAAVSWEAAEQYGGGSGGSGAITLPSALESSYANQINTGNSGFSVTNPNQDILAKLAWDPLLAGRSAHFEVAAVLRRFAFYNPLTNQSFKTTGGGVSANAGVEVAKGLRLFFNQYFSKGGGRYLFGQGPDLIIRSDGSPSLVPAISTVDGLEFQITPRTILFGYYGAAYFGRKADIDPATGNSIGYGYEGSPSGHNRSLQQVSAGFGHTLWRNPSYGALQFSGQYAWLIRHPWYVAPQQLPSADLNMVYLNLRYTLPGAPPTME